MGRWVAATASLVLAVACGGKVQRSDSDADVLINEQDALCGRVCGLVASCGPEGSYEPDSEPQCNASCDEAVTDAIDAGETCASRMLDALRCYDRLSCGDIQARNVDRCENRMDEASSCIDGNADSMGAPAPTPVATDPGDPKPTPAATDPADPAETCDPMTTESPGPPYEVGAVVCQQTCWKANIHILQCEQATDAIVCTCFIDDVISTSFETDGCSADTWSGCPETLGE